MPAHERNTRLKNLATSLHGVIDRTLLSKGGLSYTHEPEITEKDIIEYASRMRISGMEKFNGPCFISIVNFYNSPEDKEKKRNAKGAFVLFLEENNATKLLKTLARADSDEGVERAGTHWAAEQVRDLLDHDVAGIHFYTLNKSKATLKIYESLGLSKT